MPTLAEIAQIKPMPRNAGWGAISDLLNYIDQNALQKQFGYPNPATGLVSNALGIPAAARVADKLSYGFPITNIGQANVPLIPQDTAEAAMFAAPIAGKYAKFAGTKIGEMVNRAMNEGTGPLANVVMQPSRLTVYHGSPYNFNKFDASKIGTGEGAQAYGHGLYVAENPSVAKDYTFVNQNWFDTGKATYKGKSIDHWYNQAQKDQDIAFRTNNKALEKSAAARLAYWEDVMTHTHPEKVLKNMTDPNFGWDEAANYAKSIDLTKFKGVPDPGVFYKVDLPDEKIAMMLDWDKPLNQQNSTIKALAKQYGLNDADHLGGDLVAAMDAKRPAGAQKMREAGITGIRYFDAGSRDANKGTSNFVVFDPNNLTILERNQQPIK